MAAMAGKPGAASPLGGGAERVTAWQLAHHCAAILPPSLAKGDGAMAGAASMKPMRSRPSIAKPSLAAGIMRPTARQIQAKSSLEWEGIGAGEGNRTPDIQLENLKLLGNTRIQELAAASEKVIISMI